jgi:hypothetical protein
LNAVLYKIELESVTGMEVLLIEIAVIAKTEYMVIGAIRHVVLPCLYIARRIHISGHQLYGILRADASYHFTCKRPGKMGPGRFAGTEEDDDKKYRQG